MGCRCAPACRKALEDASTRWPNRNRASDGCCGDQAHRARKSDHNPNAEGYALAYDLTHDPKNGSDCHLWSADVIHDPRVTYVIWNSRIFKTRTGKWEAYRGSNKHDHHMHVSIRSDATFDESPWPWTIATETPSKPTLKYGDKGQAVRILQDRLGIIVDGDFGHGTERAVRRFQVKHVLKDDGIVGSKTWRALDQSQK